MRTAQEIIDMFMNVKSYSTRPIDLSSCQAKKCAILYVDGQIEVVQQFPVSIHVEDMLKKLEKLKQEIYRVS